MKEKKEKNLIVKSTLRLPPDLAADISEIADNNEISKAKVIRTILSDYCKQWKINRKNE